MDEVAKKKVIQIRDLIKKESYKEALEQAQILIYKNTKLYQIYLMAGLCYEKLGKIKQAQQSYKQVLQRKPDEINAIKALTQMYSKIGNLQKSGHYMQQMLKILKTTDVIKYRQNLVKLVQMYQKNQDLQKIDKIFKQLLQSENQLTQQFLSIAQSYIKTSITNKCFFLQNVLPLGVKGQSFRVLQPNAKQKLNSIIIQIVRYLYSVKAQYKMDNKDISGSIYQLKQYFPFASCFLMLFLLDQYCISQTSYNATILQEIYLFLIAYYNKVDNCYTNVEVLEPEIFIVSAILSYQYLAFMKQFFILDQCFNPFYEKLGAQVTELQNKKIREQYRQKISKFILKQCRTVSKISQTKNIQDRLQSLKNRITKLDQSYLEQVIAKMAMNCFVNYQKLCDMRNLLKTRINNLTINNNNLNKENEKQGQGQQKQMKAQTQQNQVQVQPHLYKYYYDYLIKIAKLYKSLDQELSIYDVIEYVYKHDLKDLKYIIEYYWIDVSKNSKQQDKVFRQIVQKNLNNIQELLPKLSGTLQSQSIRKSTLLKIILQKYEQVQDGLKLALGTDRSFQNLQSIGFYYMIQGNFQRALRFMKEAFVIKQDQYHLIRAIFICMIKCNEDKDAYAFLERVYEGFPNVYWINYVLGIYCLNSKKIQQAYKYLIAALQAFMSGVSKSFKYTYQKTIELQNNKYSLLYMIDQNNSHILFDYFVIPQAKIYQLFPMASNKFFNSDTKIKQIKIQTQLGQILKILGRNKSSYNHLFSAHEMLQNLPEQTKKKYVLQVIATKKEYATMLFYVRAYKEASQLLKQTLKICKICSQSQQNQSIPTDLLTSYQSQIHSLLFEVSVAHLDQLMKFQSYEAVQQYINKFNQDLKLLESLVKKPSLNYYKAKYQFNILCYLHNRQIGIQKSINCIRSFLQFFGLDYKGIGTDKFYNRLVQLSNEERIIAKQCLQDYYVLLYIKQNNTATKQQSNNGQSLTPENILSLLQLFPTTPIFYILYGMTVKQTKLKISSFLKCIQLDRQSPISIDLLASLFLKQKDYITACKLFLKSLQVDLFNTKGYIGLCTCLYALIGNAIRKGYDNDKQLIQKSLNKINSYMQFLRIVDPSQNYHLLKFLKILISDEALQLFEIKAGLQQSRKLTSHKYSQKLLFKLLDSSCQYLKEFNIWKQQGQEDIFRRYLQKQNINTNLNTKNKNIQQYRQNLKKIGQQLLTKIQKSPQLSKLTQNLIKSAQIKTKIRCKLLNKLCICGNVFSQAKSIGKQNIDRYIKICNIIQQNQITEQEQGEKEKIKQQLNTLQKSCKNILLGCLIKSTCQNTQNTSKLLQQLKQINLYRVFKDIPTFEHIQLYLTHFKKQSQLVYLKKYLFYQMHLYPCDGVLRKTLLAWLLIVEKFNNLINKKIKQSVDYRLQNAFAINSDEQANNMERCHKKNAIIYNVQQPNAWIGYIWHLWKRRGIDQGVQNKQTKWFGHIKKLLKMYEGKQNILTVSSRKKAEWLLIQMGMEAIRNKNKIDMSDLPKQVHQKIEYLSKLQLNKLTQITSQSKNNFAKKLAQNLSKIPIQFNIIKYIMAELVNRFQHSTKLEQLIDQCIKWSKQEKQKQQQPQVVGFFYLLKFISICSKPSKNEDQMIQQLKNLLDLIAQCESFGNKKNQPIHSNALAIMKCMVAYLSLNYQQLQIQLNNAYTHNNRFSTYSDQILINYFQVIRVYRQLEVNHQGENVYQNFIQFVNAMIQLVKQPLLKSLFYGIKAMAEAIVSEENKNILSRELKYSLILAPVSGKNMLIKK